jgi:uncharacterized membrane protein
MAADQQPIRSQTLPGARTAGRLTAIFVQGLIALLPLAVTFAILWWLGLTAERILGGAIRWALPDEWYVRGLGIVAGVIVIFLVGVLMNIYGVPKLIRLGEKIIGRIPLVKTVYGAVRDLLGFFSRSGREGAVSQVVVVTFGDSGIKAVGLLMRDTFDDLPEGLGGEDHLVVYFPQSYQLGGMLLVVPRANVTPLDMNLEDALRFIVTAGAKAGETPSPQDQTDSAENVGATVSG